MTVIQSINISRILRSIVGSGLLILILCPVAYGETPSAPQSRPESVNPQKQFIFSWPITDNPALLPRGGTTQGPKLELDDHPSPSWQQLQEHGISDFERDRRAILAMAGSYRVTFDFLEVTPFDMNAKRERPYQSWGTERVYIDQDKGRFISLSHILEMRVVQQDGTLSEPIVMKHWRQDWQYEPNKIVEYRGLNQWQVRKLKKNVTSGLWSQAVYQVDDSPRYASYGKWQHSASFSTWISGETWRPLPRREWSVRKDYDVLIGTNRHTVTPAGWVQEENNLKAVLDSQPNQSQRSLSRDKPYLAREYGVARYERLKTPDFKAADQYYERTKHFWNDVKAAWADSFYTQPTITLRAQVDQAGLFVPLFDYANKLSEGEKSVANERRMIEAVLSDMRLQKIDK